MKKTKHIKLVLVTAVLAACHQEPEWRSGSRTYIRADSTAPYTMMTHPQPGLPLLFYHFRPYGLLYATGYRRAGYYSNAFSEEVNIGHNPVKGGIVRGGFGESALSVES
jgi:hypothetical protein